MEVIKTSVPVLPAGVSVPMAVPTGFETHEQYREYLSWKIEIQVLVTQIVDYQNSSTTEEQKKWLAKIKAMVMRISNRAKAFPPQTLPVDLLVMPYNKNGLESPAPNARMQDETESFNAKKLMLSILSLTSNATTPNATIAKAIKNTLVFSEALKEAFEIEE